MNIVIYNYLQPESGRGGGVGVYTTNLARSLHDAGHRVITLSSGDEYAFTNRRPRLKTWHDGFDRAVIVNSPMLAPSFEAFDEFGAYSTSNALDNIPALIRAKYGDIDVFHFQNVEGLTSSFLRLIRDQFSVSRLVFSAHNYGSICAEVDLWFQEWQVCHDYRDGQNCTKCFTHRNTSKQVRSGRRRRRAVTLLADYAPQLVELKRELMDRLRGRSPAVGSPETVHDQEVPAVQSNHGTSDPASLNEKNGDGRPFASFRQSNIDIFANTFDHVLAVSDRTRQVLLDRGVRPDNVSVCYIGTAHKKIFESAVKIKSIGDQLRIAYLGYIKRSKGFYLLLDALARLPDDVASRISLTVAAKRADDETAYKSLTELAPRFAAFRYFDGFTHKTLDAVLDGVNLGIVPPIWEDALPQVAIEMVSRGIPILTSDRGGAQEIAKNPDFVFSGGSAGSLQQHIEAFSTGTVPLSRFWDGPIQIFSMEQHLEDLMKYYSSESLPRGHAHFPPEASPRAVNEDSFPDQA